MNSVMKANTKTLLINLSIRSSLGKLKTVSPICFLVSDKDLLLVKTTKEPKVIYPKPPICIRIRITICPSRLKSLPVLTVTKPVVEMAEVAVNKASNPNTGALLWVNGKLSKIQPNIM